MFHCIQLRPGPAVKSTCLDVSAREIRYANMGFKNGGICQFCCHWRIQDSTLGAHPFPSLSPSWQCLLCTT